MLWDPTHYQPDTRVHWIYAHSIIISLLVHLNLRAQLIWFAELYCYSTILLLVSLVQIKKGIPFHWSILIWHIWKSTWQYIHIRLQPVLNKLTGVLMDGGASWDWWKETRCHLGTTETKHGLGELLIDRSAMSRWHPRIWSDLVESDRNVVLGQSCMVAVQRSSVAN